MSLCVALVPWKSLNQYKATFMFALQVTDTGEDFPDQTRQRRQREAKAREPMVTSYHRNDE